MRPLAFLLDMLPLDGAGRRALDETLADWRHEADEAKTMAARLQASVRGTAAVMVAVAFVSVRDVTSLETWRITGAVAGGALLMGIGVSYRSFEDYAANLAARGLTDAPLLGLWASMLPQALSFSVPLAFLAPPLGQAASRSLMGPCLALMALSSVNLAWITPQANQWFRQTTVEMLRQGAPSPATSEPGPMPVPHASTPRSIQAGRAEYTVSDLVRGVRAGGMRAREAMSALNGRAAMLTMVPVCLILGVQARRFSAARRWRRGAGLLAWMTWLTGYLVATVLALLTADLLRQTAWQATLVPFTPWLVPVVCASMTFALARLASGGVEPVACQHVRVPRHAKNYTSRESS